MFINGIADLGLRFLGALEQGDGVNGAGHVVKMEDESGYARYSYDAMGNVSENCRTFALAAEDNAYTFIMNTEYDTWGRTLYITYPDKERVSYAYDFGGNLKSVSSAKNGNDKSLVDSIRYDKFGDRTAIYFGNGTTQHYSYNPTSRRLGNLQGRTATNALMQNITYDYDGVGNVTEVDNVATAIGILGGPYTCTYTYDALNRLATTECQQGNRGYTEQRTYHNDGRIATYNLNGTRRGYSYNATQPHTLKNIYTLPNRPSDVLFSFIWDTKGNMTAQNSQGGGQRNLVWDGRNLILGMVDNATRGSAAHYVYDAQGERTFKLTGYSNSTGNKNIKDIRETYISLHEPTLYASPYLTATTAGYTKHYFAGTERLASAIGNGGLADIGTHVVGSDVLVRKHRERDTVLHHVMEPYPLRIRCCGLATLYNMTQPETTIELTYFFHPDHLSSASWITDLSGQPVQHLQYKPFGGDYIDQQAPGTDYSERFRFTGKERDAETGYDYFGARYYSSSLGIWLSVDPMSDKYPSLSPYVYCADNPMRLVDTEGKEIVIVGDKQYQDKIKAYLKELRNSGKAGAFLVNQAIKSNRTFVIANTKVDVKTELSENNNATVLPFNIANSTGTYNEDNGSVPYTPLTILAHELAHFNFPQKGTLLNENNQDTRIRAGEVNAVEWENRVRKDLGLSERKKYGGLSVYGKSIIESSKYSGFYSLQNNSNYGNNDFSIPLYGNPSVSQERRKAYYIHGRFFDSKLQNPSYMYQIRIKY